MRNGITVALCVVLLAVGIMLVWEPSAYVGLAESEGERQPFVLYTQEEDGVLRVSRYLLDGKATEAVGQVTVGDKTKTPRVEILPKRGWIVGRRSSSEEQRLPNAYLDWRTLELLDTKDLGARVVGPIPVPLGHWDGRWLTYLEEGAGPSGGQRAGLFLGSEEEWEWVGYMGINSVFASDQGEFHSWSPDGRWMVWLDGNKVCRLDITTGDRGIVGTGDMVFWLPNSQGFGFWTQAQDPDDITVQVMWVSGPRAGEYLEVERPGRYSGLSPDGRYMAIVTSEHPNPPRRIVPVPGAEVKESSRPLVSGQWFIREDGEVRYLDTSTSAWFMITPEGFERHETALVRPGTIQVLYGEEGGRVGFTIRPRVGPVREPPYWFVVADFSGNQLLVTQVAEPRVVAFGRCIYLLSQVAGDEWVLRRFDLLTSEAAVVFRSPGWLNLKKAGDYLVLAQSSRPARTPGVSETATVDLFVSTDEGASWQAIATSVLQWAVGDDKGPGWLEGG